MTSAVLKPNFPSILTVVDPDRRDDELTLDELGSRIVGMSGRLAAATCRRLLLVALFDEREGYLRFGLHSTAYWLSHQCGIARRTAVEHVRVARALAAFPALAAEMSAGRLSYSQVRAMLCEAHHHAHHDGEFYLVPAGKQKWRFVRADGRELLHVVHPDQYADGDQIERDYDTAHDAPATRWDGQRLDRAYAVSVLADRRVRSATACA